MAQRKPFIRAIVDGAQEIAVPAFVSTLCICIVFVPVVFLEGAVRFLFTPLALAVVLAMMASYFLSRTLVPTMVHFLLASEVDRYAGGEHGSGTGFFWTMHGAFNRRFEAMREWYRRSLAWSLAHRATVLVAFGLFFLLSLGLAFFTGEDFFPAVDAGQLRLHVRAPAGTRIEETDRIFGQVAEAIRRVIPEDEISRIINNVGIPLGSSNLAYSEGATIGPADGEMLISLTPNHRGSTFDYMKAIRQQVYPQFPELTFFFQSADIVSQTLNFGLQSPIDVQVVGNNRVANFEIARRLADRVKTVPGLVDVRVHQVVAAPQLRVEVDRTRAAQIGMTQRDVANNLLVSLASSSDAAPNFWLNPQNGVSYRVSVQTPQYRIDSLDALTSEPMAASGVPVPGLLTNLAQVERGTTLSVANHYNIQNVFDVYANVQDRDLGGAARDVRRVMASMEKDLPRGTSLVLRGQVQNMDSAFRGLAGGLVFAVILVYCLMVVNFQSWLDPFIIITALPGALSGILLALFVTQTTINVPSLMGAIMSIGVATSNSILLVTFANDQRKEGLDATAAALSAGYIRLRPVLMTALAMIIGMLPMALGLGEGGEQNAPLGRAVIGGLALATVATLFVVPVIYSLLRRRPPFSAGELHPELAEPGVVPAGAGPREAPQGAH
jgi:multidrug efflux pump subunit AcrB